MTKPPVVVRSVEEILAELAALPAPRIDLTPCEVAELAWLGSDAYWALLMAQYAALDGEEMSLNDY